MRTMTFTDALIISAEAHMGENDKGGFPYILHPLNVVNGIMEDFGYDKDNYDEDTLIMAILHDVVEDTDWTIEMLRERGASENVCEGLEILTHVKDFKFIEKFLYEMYGEKKKYYKDEIRIANEMEYFSYIEKIKPNKRARMVKIRDLKHNSLIERQPIVNERTGFCLTKYTKAYSFLTREKTSEN